MSGTGFERSLARSAARAGAPVTVDHHRAVAWHSATFSGDRHEVELRATAGPELEIWLADLLALDLALRDELLADLQVTAFTQDGDDVRLRIQALTVVLA